MCISLTTRWPARPVGGRCRPVSNENILALAIQSRPSLLQVRLSTLVARRSLVACVVMRPLRAEPRAPSRLPRRCASRIRCRCLCLERRRRKIRCKTRSTLLLPYGPSTQ